MATALRFPTAHDTVLVPDRQAFIFVGDRLWLDFVNTDDVELGVRRDALRDFTTMLDWLMAANVIDLDRRSAVLRRAEQQPAGATAALLDARRVRGALRALAERGLGNVDVRTEAVHEINRVLGRSAGTRRLDPLGDGQYARSFVAGGDAFAALMIPMVDDAAEALINGELARVRRCSDPRCRRVFLDGTKNGRRRWCDMATCGNRAKAARHRARENPLRGRRTGYQQQNGIIVSVSQTQP
ncbi:MAG: CGNR zinc finger domain-containing protein [Gemmatimonadaceae bacterium]|nr:CGNR zinc finger domain-containing protein [Gemmatimonadaceae bacterium]